MIKLYVDTLARGSDDPMMKYQWEFPPKGRHHVLFVSCCLSSFQLALDAVLSWQFRSKFEYQDMVRHFGFVLLYHDQNMYINKKRGRRYLLF